MHHLVLDRWSRRDSPLHRRDARAKLAALLALLIAIATTPGHATLAFALYAVLLVCGIVLARLPLLALLA
ncbi:MAG: hypothetical protein ACREH9_07055, partial [Pseudomonadota bacterium]